MEFLIKVKPPISPTVTKKRGQSADFRHPRSNTDATHTDYSHISCSSYASDSQNTTHTIVTKCVNLFTSYAQHNTHSLAHQQQHGSLLQLPDFSGSTLLDLSNLLNVIAHLQSNLPDSPSLLLLLFSFYAAEIFISSPAKKPLQPLTLLLFFLFPPVPSSLRSETDQLLNYTADPDHNSPPSHNISSIH
jgi:hypothetical protein